MLVIGRIVWARRQQNDGGVARARARRHRAQAGEQFVGVVVDGGDAVAGEQVRHQPHRHFAVFQHIGNAGRRARVVLEHVERVLVDAHDIDAGDMHPDIVRRAMPDHFRSIIGIAQDQFLGNDIFPQDCAGSIDVPEKHVEGVDALREPRRQTRPFRARDDARHDVERNQPLRRILVAVDAEGDADAAKHIFGLGPARGEDVGRCFLEPARDLSVERARAFGLQAHFVEGAAGPHLQPLSSPRD